MLPSNPVTPITPQQTALQEAKAAKEGYIRRLPVALDIAVDEAAGGPMNMTISTRMGIWALRPQGIRKHIGVGMCKFLNLFQSNHDPKAAAGDLERAKQVTADIEDSGIAK